MKRAGLLSLVSFIVFTGCSCTEVVADHARDIRRGLVLLQAATVAKIKPDDSVATVASRRAAVASLFHETIGHAEALEDLATR